MGKSSKYEKIFSENKHALGLPTKEFVTFFENYPKPKASVLDIGCGQGRDALFIARQGHRVVGVDNSSSGIRDLLDDSREEGLNIDAINEDIRNFRPADCFDIVLIDRTLHMFPKNERQGVLKTLLGYIVAGGYLLIADEKSNIPEFEEILAQSDMKWERYLAKKGFLFVYRS